MQEEKIARRYARAVVLALDDNAGLLEIEANLTGFSRFFQEESRIMNQLILNPVFFKDERKSVIDTLAKNLSWHPMTLKLANLLVDKDRLSYLPSIAAELSREIDSRLGRVQATIVTAEKLPEVDLQNIVSSLQKRVGKSVVAKNKLDPNVLGGVRAQIGGLVFDHTLETQINSLEKSLLTSPLSN